MPPSLVPRMQPDPLLSAKKALAADFSSATVREISYDEAKNVILANEWLGNVVTTEFSHGHYFGEHLAGAALLGRTAETQVSISVSGEEHAHDLQCPAGADRCPP